MKTSRKSASRALLTVTVGLALALVVAAGARVSALESGGFICGYGDCYFYYWDCDWATWQDTGNGTCQVTLSGGGGCYYDYDCNGGIFGWVGLAQYQWGTLWIDR